MIIFNKKQKNMENIDKCNFNIKFNKFSHDIQASVYAQSLISTDIALREIGKSKNLPELVLEVNAQNKGSFDVMLAIVALVAEAPILAGATSNILSVISTYLNLIEIKKSLVNDEGSKIEIRGNNNYVIVGSDNSVNASFPQEDIKLLATNQLLNDSLSNSFSAISKDQTIESIEVSGAERSVVVQRENFSGMSEKRVILLDDVKETLVSAELTISKIVLDKPLNKWAFIYQGRQIQAVITDEEFWQSVFGGEKFGYGEKLIVDLRIKREYDPRLRTHLDKEYIVEKVHDHILTDSDIQQLSLG